MGSFSVIPGSIATTWFAFGDIGLGGNLAAFAAAAAVVWWAGARLARYGDLIAGRTKAGQAFIGIVLLGFLVSLPEATLSAVAALLGNAELAVNALVGGVSMTMLMLALTDLIVGREPLSRDVQHPVVLLQGALTVLMLTVAAAGIVVGDRLLPGAGLVGWWTTALFVLYVASIGLVRHVQRLHPWTPDSSPPDAKTGDGHGPRRERGPRGPWRIAGLTASVAAAVFAAGTVLAFSADALTQQTALGAGFIGMIFGGVSTSLPELSTTIAAARLKQFEMAFADAFGTNQCSLALLFLADLIYPGEPILNRVGSFSSFAILLACALTTICLAGLLVRPKRAYLRMGIDSIAILFVTAAGLVILYQLR